MSEPSKAAMDAATEYLGPLIGWFADSETLHEMASKLALIIDRHARSAEVVGALKEIIEHSRTPSHPRTSLSFIGTKARALLSTLTHE